MTRPLILVHGLWDTPDLFRRFLSYLSLSDRPVLTPYLSHSYGYVPLRSLAIQLNNQILDKFGPNEEIDLLGFSMGGIVSRIWLQELGGGIRTRRFISVGSPHFGTFTAQLMPGWLMPGIADMKCGSPLLNALNRNISLLHSVSCASYFCYWDLMVFPPSRAVLPVGELFPIPVLTHRDLISHPKSFEILSRAILQHE